MVAVRAFERRLRALALPRLVLTPFPLGRVLGLPEDAQAQRRTLTAALKLLESAEGGGSEVELDWGYFI